MNQPAKKPQAKSPTNDNLIEQLRDMGRGVAHNVTSDLISGVASDALSSLFGTPKSGQLREGQEINMNQAPPPPQQPEEMPFLRPEFPFRRPAPREEYRSPFSQEQMALLQQQEAEVAKKIDEIRLEIKALIMTIRSVDRQIQQAVSQEMVDPGAYHLNFLDRLKTMLKLMRKSLADSSSWLNLMQSRKKEKRYWNQYKKKGTTFGLSHERVVSTQVG